MRKQIDIDEQLCPACNGQLSFDAILHHMICAYVGPRYDFAETAAGYVCPKCRRGIVSNDRSCEIVGDAARCDGCGREMIVSPVRGPVQA